MDIDLQQLENKYRVVPREQWVDLTAGTHVVFTTKNTNLKLIGYVQEVFIDDDEHFLQLENSNAVEDESGKSSWPIPFNNIATLMKSLPTGSEVEFSRIDNEIRKTNSAVIELRNELTKERESRKVLEVQIEMLKKHLAATNAFIKRMSQANSSR